MSQPQEGMILDSFGQFLWEKGVFAVLQHCSSWKVLQHCSSWKILFRVQLLTKRFQRFRFRVWFLGKQFQRFWFQLGSWDILGPCSTEQWTHEKKPYSSVGTREIKESWAIVVAMPMHSGWCQAWWQWIGENQREMVWPDWARSSRDCGVCLLQADLGKTL